jgi:speckle-type POZ protein
MPPSQPAVVDGPPSRSAPATSGGAACGYHLLKIVGYSLTKAVPGGKGIKSRAFSVGDRTWFVKYFPNGSVKGIDSNCIHLMLVLDDTVAEDTKARITFSLVDQHGNLVPPYSVTSKITNFSEETRCWYPWISREILEKSEYLKDDSFTLRIDVTVMKDVHKDTEATPSFVAVPPPDMHQHFGNLLSSKEAADVQFRVGNKTFPAHRLVLAARSPVFKAELYGTMKESVTTNIIPIHDMEAEVFNGLLTFMYTDTFPEMKEQEESPMAQHLLVAADRYLLERLKLICEDKLSKHIDADSAVTIMALAEKHNCPGLKEACLQHIRSLKHPDAVVEKNGIGYLTRSNPRVLKGLMSKVIPRWLLRRKSRVAA